MKLRFFNKGQKAGDILSNAVKFVKLAKIPGLPKDAGLKLSSADGKAVIQSLQKMVKDMGNNSAPPASPAGPRMPMKYPYTMGAKILQFPYKFYYKTNWMFRYYPLGIITCFPVFWYISGLSNSKQNKATWDEIRRKEREEGLHKFDD